jgi:hypothetical protein
MNQTIDLNGTWQLRWNDGERGERANRVLAGDVNWSRAWSASVPGSVHETLLEHGAELDARDVDHESTPAQWMLGERTEVARLLVRRGCWTDLLLAAAVGDVELVRRHLDAAGRGVVEERLRAAAPPCTDGRARGV